MCHKLPFAFYCQHITSLLSLDSFIWVVFLFPYFCPAPLSPISFRFCCTNSHNTGGRLGILCTSVHPTGERLRVRGKGSAEQHFLLNWIKVSEVAVTIQNPFLTIIKESITIFLDRSQTFSHSCMIFISFHFLLQISGYYWPFGLVIW